MVQILPLPGRVVQVLSPRTAATLRDLLADLPDSEALQGRMTLSFYLHVTLRDLRLVLAAVAVLVAVLSVFRTPAQIKRLLAYICLTGAVVAILAIAQVITRADKIYWVVPTAYRAGRRRAVCQSQPSRPIHEPVDRCGPGTAAGGDLRGL